METILKILKLSYGSENLFEDFESLEHLENTLENFVGGSEDLEMVMRTYGQY